MSKLGDGASKLATGKGLALLVGLVTAPIVSRLFQPVHFGVAGIVHTVATWCLAFACLGYSRAIPLSRSRAEVRALVRLCAVLTLGLTAGVALGALAGRGALAAAMDCRPLRQLVWLVPAIFLVGSLVALAHSACTRLGRYGLVSVSHFAGANLGRAFHIAVGLVLGGSALYLLLGTLAGNMGALLLVGALLLPAPRSEAEAAAERIGLGQVAREHRQFPLVNLWSSVISKTSLTLPLLLLGGLFGARVVGWYVFGHRILLMPMKIVGGSVGQVFYPEGAAEWHESGHIERSMDKSLRIVSAFCLLPVVALGLAGPLIFRTVFAGRWYEAGVYAQIQAPWLLGITVFSPISSVFLIRRQAHLLLFYNVALLVLRSAGVLVGHAAGSPRVAMACLSVLGLAVTAHQTVVGLRLGHASPRSLLYVWRELRWAVACLLPGAAAFWAGDYRYVAMVLLVAGAALYYGHLYRREPMVREKVHRLLAHAHAWWQQRHPRG